ncbi:MAG: helix-turn-helix domain-containing protein [Mycobacteriales bacterium]
MSGMTVGDLGAYIREQRRMAQFSVRQLARLAGVSNPYLSQVERGLRKPSAEILQQIAKGLRISAETLYVQAGILEERLGDGNVATAILRDKSLGERQKQVLLEIYQSFCRENGVGTASTDVRTEPAGHADPAPTERTEHATEH